MAQTTQLLTTLIILTLTYQIIKSLALYRKRTSFKKLHNCQPPPKYPHRDPLFGLDLYLANIKNLKAHSFISGFVPRWRTLGSTYSGLTLGSPTIWTVDPENLKSVHGTNASHYGVQPMRLAATLPLLGRGVFTTDGPFWEHSRALIRPTFTRSNVANLPAFEVHFAKFLKLLPKDGETFDLGPFLNRLFLDTSTEFLLGESMRTLDSDTPSEAREFLDSFHYGLQGMGTRMQMRSLRFLHWDRKWNASIKTVHAFIDGYVEKALNFLASQKDVIGDGSEGEDVPGEKYILLHDMAKKLSDRVELRHQILHVFMAGHDSSSIALSNTFFHLCRNPTIFKKLRKEVLAASKEPLTFEDLKNVHYLQWVIKESLRITPIVTTDTRIANRDTVLPTGGGPNGTSPVFVSKGSGVTTVWPAVQRLAPCFQPDPEVFRPERWEALKPGWGYLPFGGGPRVCPGQNLALTEVAYVLSRMAQEFEEIECRDEVAAWIEKLQLTATSRNGIKIALTPA